MKRKDLLPLAIIPVLTLVFTLACGLIPILSGDQEETTAEQPTITAAPPTEEVPVERVQLDPCTLLTEEEVGEVLEGPAQMQPAQGMGGCVFGLQSDDPSAIAMLTVSAAQGNEAKAFIVLSVGLLAGFSGDPNMMTEFETLNNQLPDLTLVEVVNRMADMFEGTGVNVNVADRPGESALWLAYEDEFYSQGTLLVVQGAEYASLTLIGGDMAAAPDRLASLAGTVFDRLPPAFYVLDEDGDGDFSFEFSSEVELGEELEEPEPTLEIVSGLVWVAAPNAGQVYAIDPMANEVTATIDVGRFPSDIAVAEGNVWVVSETEGTVWRIDPNTFEVVETISLGGNTLHIAAGQGSVWVTGGLGLRQIDLTTGTRYGVMYNKTYDVAIGENAIWVSQSQDQQLLKIDPGTRSVVATVKLEGRPSEIAYGHGMVWTILSDKNEVVGVDPATSQVVTTLSANGFVRGLTVDPSRIWYGSPFTLNYIESTLSGSGASSTPNSPTRMTYYAGSLWFTSSNDGLVTRINPENFSVIAVIDLGTDPSAIAAGE